MPYQSILRPALFLDQVMLVTGGGSGIGRCVAHELAALGAQVIITGRNAEKLDRVVAEISADGGHAMGLVCDNRDETMVKQTIATVVAKFGKIDGLVNNAGGQFPAALETLSYNGFDAVIRNNLHGTFLMMREVYNQSMAQHGGSIVNMTLEMWNGLPMMGHSGAARAGIDNLTKTAAVEWAKSGVRVNAVAPGWILSSGLNSYQGAIKAMMPHVASMIPLQRMGTESEISATICFLLSAGAAFISGMNIRVDGAASQGTRMYPLQPAQHHTPFNGFHRASIPDAMKDHV